MKIFAFNPVTQDHIHPLAMQIVGVNEQLLAQTLRTIYAAHILFATSVALEHLAFSLVAYAEDYRVVANDKPYTTIGLGVKVNDT